MTEVSFLKMHVLQYSLNLVDVSSGFKQMHCLLMCLCQVLSRNETSETQDRPCLEQNPQQHKQT